MGLEPLEARALMAGPAPADFDGDGQSDFAVYGFDPSRGLGVFTVDRSTIGELEVPFGGRDDRPIAGDYDGDGRADVAVFGFSPANGFSRFAILPSGGGPARLQPFGGADDVPVSGDFDGDGVTEVAVFGFSPANGFSRFAAVLSGGSNAEFPDGVVTLPFGGVGDRPITGDFDGDGVTDFGVYGFSAADQFSRFAIRLSGGPSDAHPSGTIVQPFGGDDLPLIGDFDGDGRDDLGVFGFSPAEGFSRFGVLLSGGPSASHPAGVIAQPFGGRDDRPVSADFDGDRRTDLAVYGFSPADGVTRFAVLPSGGGVIVQPMGEPGSVALPPLPTVADTTGAQPSDPSRPPFRIEWVNRLSATEPFTAGERAVIDRAIDLWEGLVTDIGRPDNTIRVTFNGGSQSNTDMGDTLGLSTVKFDAQGPFEATVSLDNDGGGQGWFVDPTPADSAEFPVAATPTFLIGGPSRFDLFSTVVHELGHVLGLGIGFDSRLSGRLETLPGAGGQRVYRGTTGVSAVLTSDLSHLDPTFHAYDLMMPDEGVGVRGLPSELDLKLLADIYGYRVSIPPIPPDTMPPAALGASVLIAGGGDFVIAVDFNDAIEVLGASDPSRYGLFRPDGSGRFVPVASPFDSASFDTSSLRLRLSLRPGLSPSPGWRLLIPGTGASALVDVNGNPLDGDRDGRPGGDAMVPIRA